MSFFVRSHRCPPPPPPPGLERKKTYLYIHMYCVCKCYLAETIHMQLWDIFAGMFCSLFVFVCFITKSFLTYSCFPPTPALSTISRPLSSSMCSITPETANICSSYYRMRGPGIGCWFSDRSNCSHRSFEAAVLPINPNIYTDQWEPIVMYHSITFTFTAWSLYNYADEKRHTYIYIVYVNAI